MSERALVGDTFDRLEQATAGNKETLVELCRDYISEARSTIANLRDALAEDDAERLRDRAHYLKGSSMMLGAHTLSQHCAALEQLGRDRKVRDAGSALQEAIVALHAVEAELAERLGSTVIPAENSAV